MKVVLEENVPGLTHGKNPMLSWAIRHGAWLHTRYSVGRDGRSPYHHLRGKAYTGQICELGEQ
eukprot:6732572-Alexandrium_andersonii.AAC.1